jgi:nitrilase
MTSSRCEPFRVAVVQTSPVFLDRAATVEKACELIGEAGAAGAKLVAFPECFIPTYPLWVWFIRPVETRLLRDFYADLLDNAVSVPSEATDRLCAAARQAGTAVLIGMNEVNSEASASTLYNTVLCIGPEGEIVGRHRKLIPTVGERLVHGMGDGSSLGVFDLGIGRVSCLTCWENYMPLARHAMWAWGAEIHVAPTWDRGEPWISTLRHTAKEGRVYVMSCCSAVRRDDIPDRYSTLKEKFLPADVEWINPGHSAIVDPDGKFVAGPVEKEQRIIYGEIDPREVRGPRFQLDVGGHYSRPDIFQLTVNREVRPAISTVDGSEPLEGEEV